MAPQTRTQRQATAKKAAATRKRNAASSSAKRTRTNARRTTTSARTTTKAARETGRAARTTARQAARTTARRASAEGTRLEGVARQAERALLIPVGAALEARDRVVDTARTYTNRSLTQRQLNRFERRGATALRRNRRAVERQIRSNGFTVNPGEVVERVRSAV
jgi:hypothetical protein